MQKNIALSGKIFGRLIMTLIKAMHETNMGRIVFNSTPTFAPMSMKGTKGRENSKLISCL
jgi:hypothetical protein